MFDNYEKEYKEKVARGEIKEDADGDGQEEGGENVDNEELKKWSQEQEAKRQARGGGQGMKKVQEMLDGMGMQMVTEDEVNAYTEKKKELN